ncbi:hypothetical protein SLE2022_403830 [Rubroshorea leprosula]
MEANPLVPRDKIVLALPCLQKVVSKPMSQSVRCNSQNESHVLAKEQRKRETKQLTYRSRSQPMSRGVREEVSLPLDHGR